ncbi:MAG: hypothetical protein AVDCRST_MAG78-2898 [uncultured Rubrobacteraceae bacterium]|uniref:Uncharacterized protein n=1 Tax=uncultured Rubrobacteraceae bacterium TaxID=349277 RepID=A0A6J4QMC5_9ACTN|nr:MAG: hypothetical protein AVDCRST_MAG78-2898 [uncultured Rubrobacteraceae bacterium]
MLHMERLLSKVGSRFTKVPERNHTYGVLSLVGGLIPVALLSLPYAHQDHYLSLLHLQRCS